MQITKLSFEKSVHLIDMRY